MHNSKIDMLKLIIINLLIVNLFVLSNLKAENLVEVVNIALQNNFDYKANVENYNANMAQSSIGKSYIYPTLDLQGSYYTTSGEYNTDGRIRNIDDKPLDISLQFVQPIFNVNAFNQYSKANLLQKQALINLEKDKNTLFLTTTQYYFDVLSAIDDLDYVKAQKQSLAEQMKQVEQQIKVGKSRVIDIEEIKAKYLQVEAQEYVVSNDLVIKKDRLNNYINSNIEKFSRIGDKLDRIIKDNSSMADWVERAKKNNLDILSLQIAIFGLEQDVDIARSQYYPNLAFVANYDIKSGPTDSQTQKEYDSNNLALGLLLKMNLFEGGNTIKKTKVATSTKKNYEYQLKSLESTISNLTKQYYLNVFDGLLQISSLEQSVISAEKFLQAATRSYQVGLKTTTDVLIANENYYNAKRLLSKAKYSFLLSALALKSTVGPLNVEDITNLNQFLRG